MSTTAAVRKAVTTQPKFDVIYTQTRRDGSKVEFFDAHARAYTKTKRLKTGVTEDHALEAIKEAQAAHGHSGFNVENGYFWAHSAAPNERPEHVLRWWLQFRP